MQRDFWSPDLSPVSGGSTAAAGGAGGGGGGVGARSLPLAEGGGAVWASDRAALRKTVSVDDRMLQPAGGEQPHLRLLSRLERGRKKLHNIHVSLFVFCLRPSHILLCCRQETDLVRQDIIMTMTGGPGCVGSYRSV